MQVVYSTLPGGPRSPAVYTINCGGPRKVAGPIAPGARSCYSVFTVQTDGTCDLVSGTGVVRRTVVAGGHAQRVPIPGAPGADMLAVSGRNLLEAPAVIASMDIQSGQTLELRGLVSGTPRWLNTVHAIHGIRLAPTG